ncbi:MAG: RHS repeat-associated core domain-containing protein [Chloroflexi bacterium]|nr:RHS repeat-associated core domain-containing protein [Chloroflexota bacterium]
MDDPSTPASEGFGLMHYGARMYDPALGRFTSADTIVPGGVQGYDRYAYVNNNPIRYNDPTGTCVLTLKTQRQNVKGEADHPHHQALAAVEAAQRVRASNLNPICARCIVNVIRQHLNKLTILLAMKLHYPQRRFNCCCMKLIGG